MTEHKNKWHMTSPTNAFNGTAVIPKIMKNFPNVTRFIHCLQTNIQVLTYYTQNRLLWVLLCHDYLHSMAKCWSLSSISIEWLNGLDSNLMARQQSNIRVNFCQSAGGKSAQAAKDSQQETSVIHYVTQLQCNKVVYKNTSYTIAITGYLTTTNLPKGTFARINIYNTLHHKIIYNKKVVWMNDKLLLAIKFIIYAWSTASRCSYMLLLREFKLFGQIEKSYLMYSSVNDWTYTLYKPAYKLYFIAVFIKMASAECAQSKAYQVLTQVNFNLKVTTI